VKQVEGFLNNKHKFSFIAQTEEDMIKLKTEVYTTNKCVLVVSNAFMQVKEKLKLSVNVILDPKATDNSDDISNYTPFHSIDEMR